MASWNRIPKIISGQKINVAHTKLAPDLTQGELDTVGNIVAESKKRLYLAWIQTSSWTNLANGATAKAFLSANLDSAARKKVQTVMVQTFNGINTAHDRLPSA